MAKNSRGRSEPHDLVTNCTKPMGDEEWQREMDKQRQYNKQQIGATLNVLLPGFAFAVEQLQQQVYAANEVQGFWEGDPSVGEKIALMHSELSEALEADRKGIDHDDKIPDFTGLEAELADCVIRIFDFAGAHDLRLGQALQAKLIHNLTRDYKHGKAY